MGIPRKKKKKKEELVVYLGLRAHWCHLTKNCTIFGPNGLANRVILIRKS
jgi:hypothetical protein